MEECLVVTNMKTNICDHIHLTRFATVGNPETQEIDSIYQCSDCLTLVTVNWKQLHKIEDYDYLELTEA